MSQVQSNAFVVGLICALIFVSATLQELRTFRPIFLEAEATVVPAELALGLSAALLLAVDMVIRRLLKSAPSADLIGFDETNQQLETEQEENAEYDFGLHLRWCVLQFDGDFSKYLPVIENDKHDDNF